MQAEPGDILTSEFEGGRFADLYMVTNHLCCVFIGSMHGDHYSFLSEFAVRRYIWNATSQRFDIRDFRDVWLNSCVLMDREKAFEVRLRLATHGVDL